MISSINQESAKIENELLKKNSNISGSFFNSNITSQLLMESDSINMEDEDNDSHYRHNYLNKLNGENAFFPNINSQKDYEDFQVMQKNTASKEKEIIPLKHQKKASKIWNDYKVDEDVSSYLPYMGQITLENVKPRRGRKPKKQDICHLIFKNYGTVIPKQSYEATERVTKASSSLLKLNKVDRSSLSKKNNLNKAKFLQIEPLNLCIREKLIPLSRSETISENKKEPIFEGSDGFSSVCFSKNEDDSQTIKLNPQQLLIHPMILCYQNMLEKKSSEMNVDEKSKVSIDHSDFKSCTNTSIDGLTSICNVESCSTSKSLNQINNQKRKRSAIFIPPVQAEFSSSNPSNEVSICKFKFTGGTKPKLQEKKILSVDSGGNFRYFSGTGDKSMRGYEFFPRENLLKSSMSSGSHTNAFLNADSQKLPLDYLPPTLPDINNKLLNLSNVQIKTSEEKDIESYDDSAEKLENSEKIQSSLNLKRKSINRTVQRRKLEKTFKEKGFLIQTQQLQSETGDATFCKFRQLRKYTRYLFRSWKDYLPPACEKQKNE